MSYLQKRVFDMPFNVTSLILAIFVFLMVLGVILGWFVASGSPQITAMLQGIIPSLTQAEQLRLEPEGFKAVHVKLTPEGSTETINEFHPTNEGALGRKHLSRMAEIMGSDTYDYFFLNKFQTDKCYVFTTRYNSWIYRVSPGSKISKPSDATDKLTTNLIVEDGNCEPQKDCKDSKPGEFTVCRDSGGVNLAFSKADCADTDKEKLKSSDYNFGIGVADRCVENEDPCPFIDGKRDCCALAKYSGSHVYEPAYNLLCGFEVGSPEARWFACTGDKQNARIEANGVQFTCDPVKKEWIVQSGSGIQIINYPQLKYGFGYTVDDHTDLKFVLANNQNKKISDVKISVSILDSSTDIDCSSGATVNDCTKLEQSYSEISSTGNKEFNSHGLKCPSWPVDDDDFCYKAKTFDVDVNYDQEGYAGTLKKSFYIECKNANIDKEDWQKCKLDMPGEYKGLGISGIDNKLDKTCNGKNYNIVLIGPGTEGTGDPETSRKYIRMSIKEDGADKGEHLVYAGGYETINNVKITIWEIDESNAPSWKAKIWARCA